MPRPDRPTLRRALLLGAALLLATLSCGREVTGPAGTRLMRGFTFDARFDTPGLANGVAGTIVSFTKVRVVLVNSRGDTVVNRVVDFPSNSDEVSVSFDVPVASGAPSTGESMSLALAYINAQNDTVFRGGPLAVQVVPSLPGSPPLEPPVVPVTYVGVGANAASVVITPPTLSVLAGDPFTLTGVALDGQGAPIANTPIAWRSESPTRATITAPGAGAGVTLPSRGPATIIAQLLGPNAPADTLVIDVQPRAQSLAVVSGNNQSAVLNAALAQPLVVRVSATDGGGMAGVTVNFTAAAGSGSVSAPSVVTDANGLAQVTWTAGDALGAQTVSATAAGLTGSPVTFTALAPLTVLLNHFPMNGDLADVVGGQNGALVGGAAVVDGALTLDGSTGYAQLGYLIPTEGSFSVSLFVRNRTPLPLQTEYISQGTFGDAFFIGHGIGGGLRVGDYWPTTGIPAPAIDGLYHHYVVTVDSAANTTRLYVDGVLRGTLGQRITSSGLGTGTRLGRQHESNLEYLDGEIDEVRIVRGVLSAAQVTSLHAAGATTSGRIVFGTQPSNVAVGAAIAPAVVVRAEDALGRLLVGFNGPVTIALSTNPGGATLGGTLTVNAVAGIATFSNLTVNAIASGYQLTATAAGLVSAASTPFNATAGAATQLTFTQQPTNAAPNTALAPPVVVTARDGLGNVATSFTGAVTLGFGTNPSGAVFGGTVTVNAIAGVATFPDVRVSLAGVGYTLTAAATGVTGATSTAFTINDNTATRLEITQQATTVSAGIFMSPELVVTARTASNAVATGFTGDVTVSILSGPGTLCCALTATAVAGVATFPSVTFRIVSGGSTLLVSSPGVAPDTSAPITVTPGTAFQVLIGTQPSSGIAGQPITPPMVASVQDAFGNIVPTFADSVTATLITNPTGATLGGTIKVLPVNGVATFSNLTVSLPGSGYRLIGGAPGLSSTPSDFFSMGAGSLVNSWTNAAGGNWSVGTNWSLGRTPIASDTVMVLTDGTYTVTMDVSDTVSVLMVGGGLGLQTLAMGTRTLRVETVASVQPNGVLTMSTGANLTGPASVVNSGQITTNGGTISTALSNVGLLIAGGSTTVSGALTTAPASVLRVFGSGGAANLSVPSGFLNTGSIELVSQGAGFNAQLSTPTLINGPTGVISSLAGSGGSRTIAAQLDNQGTVNGTTGLILNLASAAHTNSGTISVSAVGGFSLVQTGTAPSFTNTGTVATNGGTWTVSGGLLDLRSGLVSGSTGLLSVSGSPTLRFTTATVQPRLLLQPGTIVPDPFVIPAGDSLRIRGGIFAPPTLANDGTLILESNATITSDVTTGAGSVILVRGTAVSGAPTAAFTNPLTNSATIDLTAESAGYAVQLTLPALTNTATGVINSIVGSGGSRTLTTQLTNLGTVNVASDLAINATSAAHVNSGSILLAPGDLTVTQTGTAPSFTNTGTIAANARTVTVNGGTLDLTAGLISGFGARLVTTGTSTVRFLTTTVQPRVTFSAGTILPDPFVVPAGDSLRVFGGTFAPPSLTNNGTLLLEGVPTLTTVFTTGTGSLVRVRGSSVGGSPTATFTNAFTNSATIDLVAETAGYSVTLVAPAVTNTATGVINTVSGSGGTRTLTAQLNNAGAVNIPYDLTINGANAAHTNTGSILLTTGDLAVTQSGATPSFTNTGTIATNGRTVTVAGGTIDLTSGLISGYTGRLVTTGAPTVRFVTTTVQPRVTFSAATVLPDPFVVPSGDSLRVFGGTFAPPTLTNNGLLLLEGTSTVTTTLTTGTGSSIRVRGSTVGGSPVATFTNAITNTATLDLLAESAGYSVTLVAPSVVNLGSGVINVIGGSGGTRTLTAQLNNAGVVNVPYDLTINGANGAHTNSGSILLTTGDLAITQSGVTPSFTNTGTVATNGRTVTVANGTLDLTAGLVSGFTGRLVTTGTPTVRFTTSTVQPRVTFSAGTVLPDPFTVPASDSLRVFGGTFAPPSLTNNGVLVLEGSTTVTTALTTATGSVLRVRGSTVGGSPVATFTNAITNGATIDLVAESAGYSVTLVAPSVTNTAAGVINSVAGSGGSRTLTARLDNAGVVNVPYDLAMNAASAAHVNSGSILLTTGDLNITQSGTTPSFTNTGTVAANARTVTVAGGLLDLQSGLISGYGGRLVTTGTPTVRFITTTVQPRVTFSAGTILPDPFTVPAADSLRVFGGAFSPPSLTNNGTLVLEGMPTLATALTTGTGSVLRVRGSSVGGSPVATFTNAITNTATIDLVAESAGYSVTLVAPLVTNTATGVINSAPGSGGTRTLTARLDNAGVVNVPYDLTMNAASAAHLNSGSILLTTGDLAVTQSGTTPSFTNTGTVATNGRTMTVAGGTLELSSGLVSGYTGRLITTGAPTVRFLTSTVQPRVTFSAGTVLPDPFVVPASDSLRLLGSSFAPPTLTNNGSLILEGNSTVSTGLVTGAGSVIRVRGSSIGGSPTATFTGVIVNSATIDLTTESAGYTVTLVAPGITNTAAGVINSLAGTGGTRTLATDLTNNGVVNVPYDLTLNAADATQQNNGTINLSGGDLTVTQSGTTPSFTNAGTILMNGRTMTVGGGTLDLTAGQLNGYTGRLITTGTPTVRFTTATVQPRVTLSAGTVLPDPFVVPANDSLRLFGGGFAPPSLTNNGVLILEGSPTLSTAFTTGTGSTLRVRGSSIGGSPVATFTNAFTNTALLELTAEAAGYSVQLAAPSITNAAAGVIRSLPGSGGTRTLATELVNGGLLDLPQDLTINRASAAHVNSGTITMSTGDLTITQSGTTPSFTSTGTIATNGRTLTVANGLLDLSAGLVSGYTGFLVTTGTPTVRFSSTTVQPRVTFSAGTVLPDALVIPAGDSLRVRNGSLTPASLVNNGTLIFDGNVTVGTALQNNVGGLTILRGSTALVNVTMTNSMTNAGTLRLTTENAGYSITLDLGTNTLTNAAGGTLEVLPGSAGTRFINASLLDNLGTFTLTQGLTLNSALDQRGALSLAPANLLAVSGVMTLYPGSTTTINGTLQKNGGCNNLGGAIGGTGTGATCP